LGAGSSDGSTSVEVTEQRVHPDYDELTTEKDFQLFLLAEAVDIGDDVILQFSEDDASDLAAGTSLTILGLGITETGDVADVLKDADVPAVDDDACVEAYSEFEWQVIPDTMFCAGDPDVDGQDTCQGDSGGPIVKKDGNIHKLTGVVSWGNGCAVPGFPGVYSRLSYASGWIRSVVCDEWGETSASFCDGSRTVPPDDVTSPPDDVTRPPDDGTSPPDDGTSPPDGGDGNCVTGEVYVEVEFITDGWG
jgi:secreted trypsin-like serine protease